MAGSGPDGLLSSPAPKRPDILIITLESTRADHIGPCYGYNRTTAPNICSLAQDGVLFKNAYAQATATGNSMPVLLTGRSPRLVSIGNWRSGPDSKLSNQVATIGERLNTHGYTSIAPGATSTEEYHGFF